MSDPHPKDYGSKKEYQDACVTEEDYGYCNPRKAKEAYEAEEDAGRRWDDWHDD